MTKKVCALAYSGGLDTSAMIPWLRDRGYEVHAVLVDVGQDEPLHALCERARRLGAASAEVCDAKPAMEREVLPLAGALGATYEGSYRLGTALARPFIALEQVRFARRVGAQALVHGATGKGNDQVRFEFAYRSLAPDCEILAPWKTWEFAGRLDLIDYLERKGSPFEFEANKALSLDENLWHLSVEGGALEDPRRTVDVDATLRLVADRFASSPEPPVLPPRVEIEFRSGVPVAIDGEALRLVPLIERLNHTFRHADWAWDLVLENRFTGIKSRGIYVNPAAKLVHLAIDSLARSCLNQRAFQQYREVAEAFANLLYRGEWFSQQRQVIVAAAKAAVAPLTGRVSVDLRGQPYVARILSENALFREELATFEASGFEHKDAEGFIRLNWLSAIGRPHGEETSDGEHPVEAERSAASGLPADQPLPRGGLVSSSS